MKRLIALAGLLISISFSTGCSRKTVQTGPAAPEVLVTTVTPRDVPRVLERVATLDGFINANINAQVQGYIVSRDYTEGSVVKKGDLLFQIDPRPFEAALAQAKGTLAKDQATQAKADADEKRAMDLFTKKVISVVVFGMVASNRLDRWTKWFLTTAVLTTVTGFFFSFHGFTPAIGLGIISLPFLAVIRFRPERAPAADGESPPI